MRLTYRIPAQDSISFQTEFIRDLGKKIMPAWIRESLGLVFLGANFAVALWLSAAVDRAIALTCLVWLIHWSWQKGFAFVHRKMAARYISTLSGSDTWTSEVVDHRFVTENRGLIYSFPLSELSHIYEKDEYLYLDFSSLGRARIPFSAFQSSDERFQFSRMLDSKKPIQSSQPTPGS
jgi:hypothetical protein